MSAQESSVLERLKVIKAGSTGASGSSVEPASTVPVQSDIATRLKAVKAGSGTPVSPDTITAPKPSTTQASTPDTGIKAGVRRGLQNLNPLPLLTQPVAPPTDPSAVKQNTDAFQHAIEHPFLTALSSIPIVGPSIASLAERAPHDPSGAIAEGLTTVATFKAGTMIPRIAEGMGAMPPELPPSGSFGLPKYTVPPHVDALTKAVGQTNKIFVEDKFHRAASDAFPDLKAAEIPALGRSVADLRDVAKVAKSASDTAWQPYETLLDATKTPITRNQLLETAMQNLPDEMRNTQASAWTSAVKKFAKDLSKDQYKAREIESAAQALNARLKAEYKMNNLDRAAASKLPQYAGPEALLSAYRTHLDSTIKSDTGYDAAPLRQRYGNIKAVHNAVIETPSGDDTLYDVLTHRPLDLARGKGIAERLVTHAMRQTPDQLAAKAFRSFVPEPQQPGLVLTPGTRMRVDARPVTPPESPVAPPGGFPMPASSIAPEPLRLTSGQRMLPAAGDTSVKTPPQPPESFAEALAREQTPQSKAMREVVGEGPYNTQSRPATAEEYLRTKGGREMSNKPVPKKPSTPGTPPSGSRKNPKSS